MTKPQTSLLVASLFILNLATAQASDYERFNDKWRFYGGGFYPDVSSKIDINGEIVDPPPIDFEDTLGLEESETTAFLGVQWHISNRNSLEFEYFQLKRDGFIDLIEEPIEVGDLLIEDGTIDTAFDISIGRLTYGFSVYRSERSDVQLKAGLHIADMSTALRLSGAICDAQQGETPPCPVDSSGTAAEDITAPLPHFGGSWGYAIAPDWDLNLNLIGFAIELDNIDGSLVEFDADIQWSPWRHFGIGAGLRYFNANVKSKGSELNGEFDFEYYGPAVFVAGSF